MRDEGDTASGLLRIELLDGLRVEVGGAVVTQFRTQKTACLLAYLALHSGRRHRREALMELLWPEAGRSAAAKSLSTALWSLRQQIEDLGLTASAVLGGDRAEVWLNLEAIRSDVREFEATVRRAREAEAEEERVLLLKAATSLYRGELLRGLYEDWLFVEQTRLAGLYQSALDDLCTLLEAAGDQAGALQYASLAVVAEPLSEPARARLMRLNAAAGQPLVALAHYRELARLLRRELDRAPGGAVRELARAVAAGGSPAAPLAAVRAPLAPPHTKRSTTPESVGGAVPADSCHYLPRPSDEQFRAAVARGDSIVLVKGPRETGKTSLLAGGLHTARAGGAHAVFTDLQTLSPAQLASADAFLLALAEGLADQLELPAPRMVWEEGRGPGLSLRRYLRRAVLPALDAPLVWALDEVDRLFPQPLRHEVFALFRNERAVEPEGPWSRLTLVLAYSTEAHLYLPDLDQSPFNVGTRLELEGFTRDQVAELNARYGHPLKADAELARFATLVAGQPYLVRRGLKELAEGRADLDSLERTADQPGSPFAHHLRRVLAALERDADLSGRLGALLRGAGHADEDTFLRLRSAGLVTGATPETARIHCGLYRRYLERHLTRADGR